MLHHHILRHLLSYHLLPLKRMSPKVILSPLVQTSSTSFPNHQNKVTSLQTIPSISNSTISYASSSSHSSLTLITSFPRLPYIFPNTNCAKKKQSARMSDTIREAPFGQALRWMSSNRLFRYPEERDGFELPAAYITQLNSERNVHLHTNVTSTPTATSGAISPSDTSFESPGVAKTKSRHETMPFSNERFEVEQQLALERTRTIPVVPEKTSDGILLVDWYTTDDPANPQNWSGGKRALIVLLMCLYTWVVYAGAAIYSASVPGLMEHFTVNYTEALLPLSLYVLAYGVGPLALAPLSEIPIIGRKLGVYPHFHLILCIVIPYRTRQQFRRPVSLAIPSGIIW